MKKAAFIAHSPYEIGDRVNVLIYNGVALVNPPRLTKTTQVQIKRFVEMVHLLKNATNGLKKQQRQINVC